MYLQGLFLIIACLALPVSGDSEPDFPHLLNPESLGENRLHFLSEMVSDVAGYETIEEYIDFSTGKNTFVKTNKNGHSITYYDAKANTIFHYKPFECQALEPMEAEISGLGGVWNTTAKVLLQNSYVVMRLYGVAAVWWNAGKLEKTYKSTKMIYSASHDIYKQAHKWTITDEDNKQLVHLYFVESSATKNGNDYMLELIEFESSTAKKVVRTINILTIEKYILQEVVDNLMEVPVAYGCMNKEVTERAFIQFPEVSSIYLGPLLLESYKMELEVTATEFGAIDKGAISDTLSVQVVRHKVDDVVGDGHLQLLRQRDSKQDIKEIYHHLFEVRYSIDLRRGTCEMTNLHSYKQEDGAFSLKFKNGQELDMTLHRIDTLFVNMDEFYFIKQSNPGLAGTTSYLYFERTVPDFLNGEKARIVRVYSMKLQDKEVALDRVTVWIYNDNMSEIKKSFHFNLIEASEIESATEMARLFDVSEECYLNNDEMRVGRDYAWFELTYPLSARQSTVLASHSHELKEIIYSRFLMKGHLSFFRVPKLEVMFEETGFILRALLIDVAKLSVLYQLDRKGQMLNMELAKSRLAEISVDLDHCADSCRLHKCKIMSYCTDNHRCMMSTILPYASDSIAFKVSPQCDTYLVPERFNKDEFHEISLQYTLSLLQNQDYGVLALPKMPEELTYSRQDTDLDENTYRKMVLSYLDEIGKYLEEDEHRLPMLTISVTIHDSLLILLPEKFEIEDDPLNEFSLAAQDQPLDDNQVPAFHQGFVMRKYKMNLLTPSESNKNTARLFSGLNYDQCSLACVDSKCSSFSYCVHRQECIITDIYNLSSILESYTQEDAECFISQRDFLSKFNKFPNVIRSELYRQSSPAENPSECAHSCMVAPDFKCLAFDYCVSTNGPLTTSTCLYFDERQLSADSTALQLVDKKLVSQTTGCDHYSRSYLADFVRIEYREIVANELAKLKTTTIEGRSVDKCAETCVLEVTDCSAFQFCIDPDVKGGPMQSCELIESAPAGQGADYEVVLEKDGDGKVKKSGKYFVQNINCHIFALSKDSSEAQVRDLALSGLTIDGKDGEGKDKSSGGLTLFQGIFLYLSLTVVFAAIGCGFVMLKHHNEYIRQKVERVQLLLGF